MHTYIDICHPPSIPQDFCRFRVPFIFVWHFASGIPACKSVNLWSWNVEASCPFHLVYLRQLHIHVPPPCISASNYPLPASYAFFISTLWRLTSPNCKPTNLTVQFRSLWRGPAGMRKPLHQPPGPLRKLLPLQVNKLRPGLWGRGYWWSMLHMIPKPPRDPPRVSTQQLGILHRPTPRQWTLIGGFLRLRSCFWDWGFPKDDFLCVVNCFFCNSKSLKNDVSWSDHSVLSEVDTLKHTLKQLQSNQSILLLYRLFTRKECGSWGRFPNGCRLAFTSFVSLRRRSHRRSETEWSFLQPNYCTAKAKTLERIHFFLWYFISKHVFLILPKSIHFFFGEDLSFLLIFKPFESLKIHGSVVSLVSSRSGAPRNARRSPRDLCDWSGRGNPNTSKSVTLKMFQGLRIPSGCNRRLKMSGCKTIRIFEFTGWQVPHKKAAQSSSWEPMRWKDMIWKQLIVYIIYTPYFQLATNFLQVIHIDILFTLRHLLFPWVISLDLPPKILVKTSLAEVVMVSMACFREYLGWLLKSLEILAYLRLTQKKREAAALRCLSDVVDAGDRNFEIDIAEEFPVLDQTFGIVFDLFSINLGSIILHDAWISLCKDI